MSDVLAGVYSRSDAFKRKLIDALRNPGATVDQLKGRMVDDLRSAREQISAAANEGVNYGPASRALAMKMAEGYNPAGIIGPEISRSLPLRDYGNGFTRFSKPLPAGEMYREVNAEGLADLFKGNMPFGAPRSFYADVPEMALGQGANKGVMMRVESEGIKGRPYFGKPMLDQAFLNKMGEFEVNAQPTEIAKNLREVWISPEGTKGMNKSEMFRFKALIDQLRKSGMKVNEVDRLPGRD